MSPFGSLAPEVGGLSTTDDGSLWFTTSEDNQLHRYDKSTKRFISWQFAGELAMNLPQCVLTISKLISCCTMMNQSLCKRSNRWAG